MRIAPAGIATLALALLAPALAAAQDRPPRRQQPIEIRGQVPTPQVVTVRPREVPNYDRRVLVPNFFDRDFWPSILPPYQIVPESAAEASGPVDCTTDSVPAAPPSIVPRDTTGTGAPPGSVSPVTPDGASPARAARARHNVVARARTGAGTGHGFCS